MTSEELKEYIDNIVNGKYNGHDEDELMWAFGERDMHAPSLMVIDTEVDCEFVPWPEAFDYDCMMQDRIDEYGDELPF